MVLLYHFLLSCLIGQRLRPDQILFWWPPDSTSDFDSDTRQDPTFGPGNPRFEAAQDLLAPDGTFPQFDPENPTKEVVLPQETKEYTNVYFDCTDEITTEMEQPCNRLMLYLAGECENNDMWLLWRRIR